MAKVLAVNNYPTEERFARVVDALKVNGSTVRTIAWNDSSSEIFNRHDAVVLSGSPDMLSGPEVQAKFSAEIASILDSSSPILGICFGHQMIAHAFGSKIVKDDRPVLEMVKTTVLEDDPLFSGLPRSLMLLESRHEVVSSVPDGFVRLAKSETSEVAAIKHTRRPLYGLQSHPERYTKADPDGNRLIANFLRAVD
jgi:GMP synthase (glutamine-hydrolysing)